MAEAGVATFYPGFVQISRQASQFARFAKRRGLVPVDKVASIIYNFATVSAFSYGRERNSSFRLSLLTYHVVNPHKTSWPRLLSDVQQHLGLETVSSAEWSKLLRESSEDGNLYAVSQNPALKLLDFVEEVFSKSADEAPLPLALNETVQACLALKEVKVVDDDIMRLWLEQWQL